jgi:prolyl-tRNA synthetase
MTGYAEVYMKFSKLFCPTLKEVPKDAEIISHQLMLRAGLIQKVASGLYSYLPLGLRVIKKIEAIIREELTKSDCQEVVLPLITPASLWEESGRLSKYGPELLRIQDRHGNPFCYGPTFEEAITDMFRQSVHSYKALPMTLYQIQNKFRDEIRPRFGLMRSREFIMKDAYSFHLSEECLDVTYQNMENAYHRIFKRCGLDAVCVQADSGAIGGDVSKEYMIKATTGEDEVLICLNCQNASNKEVIEKTKQCAKCQSTQFESVRGIEVGHIFKLGQVYSTPLKAQVLNDVGALTTVQMGCYGIGVGRTMAAAIEQHNDDKGIQWPLSIAPYTVIITITNPKDESIVGTATQLYQDLQAQNVDVLLDDRPVSTGVKFKDAELIGFPIQVIVGKHYLETGTLECRIRKTGQSDMVSQDRILGYLTDKLTQ